MLYRVRHVGCNADGDADGDAMNACFVPRYFVAVMCCAALGLCGGHVQGADVQVNARTDAQAYQLRNRWGEPVLSRRRVTQTLGLDVDRIGQGDKSQTDESLHDSVEVSFRAMMRVDADFGIDSKEVAVERDAAIFVPAVQRAPFDLMYGYFDVRNVAGRLFRARIGRQYVVDALGWWSFDGALVRMNLPIYLGIEGYTGWEQRGGLAVSSPRFERDGVWRGDRLGMQEQLYPEFLQSSLAPAHGVAVETVGLPVFHGRFAYRKVWNTGAVATRWDSRDATVKRYEGWRTSQQRLAASVDATVDDIATVSGALVYDVLRSMVTSWYATADMLAVNDLVAGVQVDRQVPSFDGDSIWNWFAADPMFSVLATADWTMSKQLRLGLSGGVRWVDVPVQVAYDTNRNHSTADQKRDERSADPAQLFDNTLKSEKKVPLMEQMDGLVRASMRYDLEAGQVGATAMTDRGRRGNRQGVDVFGDYEFYDRYGVSARASIYDWREERKISKRKKTSTTSFGYVLGAGYRVHDSMMARLAWEHDINETVGQRYRILASLQLRVVP